MRELFEVLIFVVIAVVLLWFGYTLFVNAGFAGRGLAAFDSGFRSRRGGPKPRAESAPGEPQTCPVCSAKLYEGQLVSSAAFPSLNGGKDRFMHIRGCSFCLTGERDRVCPVCYTVLYGNEILVCRMFERPGRRTHVHVLGCTQCKKGPR